MPQSQPRHPIQRLPSSRLSHEKIKVQVATTIKEIGHGYIDLIFINVPDRRRQACKWAWKSLIKAKEEGRVPSLGIRNYGIHHLGEMEIDMIELEENSSKAMPANR